MDVKWINDFAAFYAHIGDRPTKDHSIERIDNNKGYVEGNVKWALISEQSVNKRNVRIVEYLGEEKPLIEFCRDLGLSKGAVWYRINKAGWSVHDALSTPIR